MNHLIMPVNRSGKLNPVSIIATVRVSTCKDEPKLDLDS